MNYYPHGNISNLSAPLHFSKQPEMPTSQTDPNLYPSINTLKLKTSAKQMHTIIQQVQLLTATIEESDQFAYDLKNAAQLSNHTEVEKLIASSGITAKFETKFTPDHIRVILTEGGCCSIAIILYW